MSQEAVEKLLGRLITDDVLRVRAHISLRAVCREEGFCLSEEELTLVGRLDVKKLDGIAETLHEGIKRFNGRLRDVYLTYYAGSP